MKVLTENEIESVSGGRDLVEDLKSLIRGAGEIAGKSFWLIYNSGGMTL